jgi:hypothetical protein
MIYGRIEQAWQWCRLPAAMFCPQCHAEYRPGFTYCTDCDVDLVYELPAARNNSSETNHQGAWPGDNSEDPFCSFWQGDDARLHAELCTVLDEAGIPQKTVRRQDHLFNLNNYPAFQIGVPFSLFEKAEAAVKDAYELESSDPDAVQLLNPPLPVPVIPESLRSMEKLPATLTSPDEENIPGPREDGDDTQWEPEANGIEVWSGDDRSICDMLVASLRENEIHVRRVNSDSMQSLFVSSKQEARAKEIVREVAEGVPPE